MVIEKYIILVVLIPCVLLYQTAYAEPERLEYAVVDFEKKTLNLYFNESHMISSIDLSVDGGVNFSTYVIDGSKNISLNSNQLEQFKNLKCPTIYVNSSDNYTAPMWFNILPGSWTSPRPGVDVSCILTYKIDSVVVPFISERVHRGLEVWGESNPGLEFREIKTGVPNINIKMSDLPLHDLGNACDGCLYTFTLEHELVKQPCAHKNGPHNKGAEININYRLLLQPNDLSSVVAHEFGHSLGLCHHQDPENLMYNNVTNDTQIPYNYLGYNIPTGFEKDWFTYIEIMYIFLFPPLLIFIILIIYYIIKYKKQTFKYNKNITKS